jgi:hypothetical protein
LVSVHSTNDARNVSGCKSQAPVGRTKGAGPCAAFADGLIWIKQAVRAACGIQLRYTKLMALSVWGTKVSQSILNPEAPLKKYSAYVSFCFDALQKIDLACQKMDAF